MVTQALLWAACSMLDNPFGEEFFPNAQYKPTLQDTFSEQHALLNSKDQEVGLFTQSIELSGPDLTEN